MSRVPTDADEDEIRRILETMWERTSRAEHETTRGAARTRSAAITLRSNDRTARSRTSSAVAGDGTTDCANGVGERATKSPAARRSLFDVLNGAVVPSSQATNQSLTLPVPEGEAEKTNVIPLEKNSPIALEPQLRGSTGPTDANKQLSSLNYAANETGGHPTPTGDNAMHSSSEEGTNGNAPELNGTSPKFDDIEQPRKRPLKPREETAAARQVSPHTEAAAPAQAPPPPAAVQPIQAAAPPAEETKRQMAPFKDTRMCRMGGGTPSTSPPATAPIQAPAATASVQQAPAPENAPIPPTTAKPVNPASESAAELMRPVLRQWLGENMPKIVESALEIEVAQSVKLDQAKKSNN